MRPTCRACEAPLSPDNAVRRRTAPDGLDDVCRPCEAARMRAAYWRDPEAKRTRNRESRRRTKEALADANG